MSLVTDRPAPVGLPTPRRARRAALAVTGFLACALPTVFTINISRMLLMGIDTDHRFHQLTGQGLVLFALWFGGLLPLLRAGWAGRRPSPAAGLLHVAFTLTGAACAALAPGGGAPYLVSVVAVTGGLVWLALPHRPRLRGLTVALDPVAAPVALLSAGLYTPYALDQIALQNAASGYHAQNPHMFDMAWLVTVLVVLAVLAALLPGARRLLLLWAAGGSLVLGIAGLGCTDDTWAWALVVALGVAAAAAARAAASDGSSVMASPGVTASRTRS